MAPSVHQRGGPAKIAPLDGVVDLAVVSRTIYLHRRLIFDHAARNKVEIWNHGTANPVSKSNLSAAGWVLSCYAMGCRGVLPWSTVKYGTKYLKGVTSGDTQQRALFIVASDSQKPRVVPTLRLAAFREAALLVEYLEQLRLRKKSTPGQIERLIRNYLVNEQRDKYKPHTRWKGFPFAGGKYHSNVTWPYTLKWNSAAAAGAQKEADAVAAGATPTGKASFANPGQLPIYISGLNTADYMVGGKERSGSFSTSKCTLCKSNGFMRMAVFYHDPGGDGPVLVSLGVGAADLGNGDTWWVMRFSKLAPPR